MGFTKRFALVLVICAALIAIAGFAGGKVFAVAACVLVNVIALVLVVYDVVATPKPDCLEVRRELEEKLSLGGTHTVKLTVRNNSRLPLRVELCDDVPEHLEHGPMPAPAQVKPYSETAYTYTLMPKKRGEYVLPRISARYPGVLGLIRRQKRFATPDGVFRVYPNMRDLSEYGIQALSKNLLVTGVRRVRTHSDGGEFSSLRPYVTGDNYRTINWSATARSGALVVNTYSPERNQFVYALLDASRVMNTPYNNILMLDYCINAAFLLADYCIRGGDNIGMEVFASGVQHFVKAGKGNAQFELLADKLYAVESSETAADYDRAASVFATEVKRRSLVFIFTQLFNAEEANRFVQAVRARLSRHLVCAITIGDPRVKEIALSPKDAGYDVYMRSAATKYLMDRRKIADVLTNAGIMCFDVEPDKLSLAAVSAYLNIKKQGIL